MFALLPVKKLSTQRTSCPCARRRSQRCEPRKPAPPVTRILSIPTPHHHYDRPGQESPSCISAVALCIIADMHGTISTLQHFDPTGSHTTALPEYCAIDDLVPRKLGSHDARHASGCGP